MLKQTFKLNVKFTTKNAFADMVALIFYTAMLLVGTVPCRVSVVFLCFVPMSSFSFKFSF